MLKKLDQYIIKPFFGAVSIYFQRAVFHLYGEYCGFSFRSLQEKAFSNWEIVSFI